MGVTRLKKTENTFFGIQLYCEWYLEEKEDKWIRKAKELATNAHWSIALTRDMRKDEPFCRWGDEVKALIMFVEDKRINDALMKVYLLMEKMYKEAQ